MRIQGDRDRWQEINHVYRCNPLSKIDANFRKRLRLELAEALRDTRKKSEFFSYRLNLPSPDEQKVLLTLDDFQQICDREVLPRSGRPIVGVDLGAGRAWSSASAIWPSGRLESFALAPGVPNLEAQEKRDIVPPGTYRRLYEQGQLEVADGLRVPSPRQLVARIIAEWGTPSSITCDRFRLAELQDAAPRMRIEPRAARWSESSEDIRALRKLSQDGPLACDIKSRDLVGVSLAATTVKSDDQGSLRLTKSRNNQARDDVSAGLVLAAGAWERSQKKPRRSLYHGLA